MAHAAPGHAMPPPPPLLPVKTLAERCLDSYYHHFFAAHPFVLPREHMVRLARELPAISLALEPLLAAMRWVGSLFIDVGASRDSLFDDAYRIVFTPAHERRPDGFLLQAMIVLIVGLDGCCQQDRAREILGELAAHLVGFVCRGRHGGGCASRHQLFAL
ncbi:hypothetical protein CDD81_571 [Ophiocordyceps australis]|uniref:Transcription factor domain-containing protein n=1 Tax=Ophiocordyceps australis TaxID=1399860 RepID=A0A2C5YEB6_9HYPO|nr:hypothetical protein CDD81_571 [Ophiocordyceps australis]